MQAYGPSFARIYNQRWGGFAQAIGPRLLDFYESTAVGQREKTLLDLCCGTGQLARLALERGYQVTGIDLSDAMLRYARENNIDFLVSKQAQFIQADAADFRLDKPVGLVLSTFDALNHLESFESLKSCFHCVQASLLEGGLFIFDLNTRLGLSRWNGISVQDEANFMLVNRGIFDEQTGRAYTRISGFIQREDGHYERFEETAYNNLFDLEAVSKYLLVSGWKKVTLVNSQDMQTPLEEPEKEGRVFFIVVK